MTGIVIGALVGVGGALLLLARWDRSPALIDRVAPYAGTGHAPRSRHLGAPVQALVRRGAQRLDEVLGGAGSVRRRLDRLGSTQSVEQFRTRQLLWGAGGFAAAIGIALVVWTHQQRGAGALLVVCVCGFALGVIACDQALSRAVRAREEQMAAELPVAAELLALAVAAGESPVRGLQRVVDRMNGALGDELGRVLGQVRTGTPIGVALDALSARTGVVPLGRFAEALTVALERGTPLADVLHAQAADVREAARRELMESGGRREVAMMVPVVFGLLPTTIVFAFYPGLVGLRLVAP